MAPIRIIALEGDETGASSAVYESVLEATAAGIRTPDLGGHAGTTQFTDEVIARTRAKLG
jgi:isocitrate dehydrogenase (NAD+)